MLLGLVLVSLLGGIFWKIDLHTAGRAVIMAHDKITVITHTPGRVSSVGVSVGERVSAGDTLICLDAMIDRTLSEANGNRVRAPEDGIVGEISAHPGQLVNAGDHVACIVINRPRYELVAFFPGSNSEQLRPGMSMHVTLEGNPEWQEITPIISVCGRFPNLGEAARYGRIPHLENIEISGPVVMVRSTLPSTRIVVTADSKAHLDGMTGEADVRTGSEPLLINILPSIKKMLGMAH